MIGKLVYKLPEEREDFEIAQNGVNYSIATHEFSEWLRSQIKYKELTDEEHRIYTEVRERFGDIFEGLL